MKAKKLDPGILRAWQDFTERGVAGLVPHIRMLGLASVDTTPKPPRAIVFLRCNETAEFKNLEKKGVVVNQRRGAIRTAIVPLEQLEALSEEAKVKRIIVSRTLRPLMDVAGPAVKLTNFKTSSGLTGSNVVIGVIDSGIEAAHADFAGRVARIWDQTKSGPGVAEGSYGLELTGNQLTGSEDADGHGTHVAGIASGNGAKYTGVATKATLVIVKTDFQTAHIADGIRYVFRVAGELGFPAVVNLSLGGHFDAHDGSDPLSQTIDEQSGPGRIVCCAAGNEGNDNIHSQIALGAASTRTARFSVPSSTVGEAALNGWYPGADDLQIAIRRPGANGLVTPFQKVITTGNPSKTYTLGNARISIQTPGPDPDNGDHNFWVSIQKVGGGTVPGGTWQLLVKNLAAATGPLHVWTLDGLDSPQVVFTGTNVTDSHKIGSPGSSSSAVTVASYTTRNKWKDEVGDTYEVGMTLNDISDFSSEGPRRDNAQKPDVAAPGAMIISCMSPDSSPDPEYRIDPKYFITAGTSMACPFISGVVALLLERDPALDPAGVKALLKSHSKIPGVAAGTFDPKWGFGLLNAQSL